MTESRFAVDRVRFAGNVEEEVAWKQFHIR
jgi:hypothetical protein